MQDLIARLEGAMGPDLDLDHAIAALVKPEDGHGVLGYTSSIDAALTLVPYQREWRVGSVTLLGTFWAEIITPTERHIGKGAKNPAIALCIAALKARLTESERE